MATRLEFTEYGDPSVLRAVEFKPAEPGPGEVLVSNRALGVNPYDWKFISGATGGKPITTPRVPGNEGSGVVAAVGSDVDGIAVGDAVIWRTYLGGYASDRIVGVDKVWAKPDAIDFDEAAGLPVAGGTAWSAVNQAGVTAGDTLLVHAAAGGVGSAAVQIAVALGATVIGTASEKNQDFVRSLGAIPVVYGPGLVDRVRALGTVIAIVDCVGSEEAVAVSRELQPALDRAVTIAHADGLRDVVSDPEAIPAALALAAQGKLRLEVTRIYPLLDAAAALTESKSGHVRGKIVLLP